LQIKNAVFRHFAFFAKIQQNYHLFKTANILSIALLVLIRKFEMIPNFVSVLVFVANSVDSSQASMTPQFSPEINSLTQIAFVFAVILTTILSSGSNTNK
jgi:hypothetical protein